MVPPFPMVNRRPGPHRPTVGSLLYIKQGLENSPKEVVLAASKQRTKNICGFFLLSKHNTGYNFSFLFFF